MDEKSKFRQRTTTSESRRYFGSKVSSKSSIGSHRKQKLHSGKGVRVGDEVLNPYQPGSEDTDSESNIAEEVIRSGKHTGEFLTESAGKSLQKRQMKKQMVISAEQRRAKEAAKGSTHFSKKISDSVDNVMNKIGEEVGKFVAENPLPIVCALVLGILIIVVSASLSSCAMVIGSFNSSAVTTSYTANDSEILAAEAYYADLESQLQDRLDQIETDYPGYDEYVYDLDAIEHDPHELISILTVLYEEFEESEVVGTMIGIFDAQYTITLTESEETRTKIETKIRWEKRTKMEEREGNRLKWDAEKKKYVLETYTYEVEVEYWDEVEYEEEVEYQYHILYISLENQTIDTVVGGMSLTDDQKQRYEILLALKGNKSYLF